MKSHMCILAIGQEQKYSSAVEACEAGNHEAVFYLVRQYLNDPLSEKEDLCHVFRLYRSIFYKENYDDVVIEDVKVKRCANQTIDVESGDVLSAEVFYEVEIFVRY